MESPSRRYRVHVIVNARADRFEYGVYTFGIGARIDDLPISERTNACVRAIAQYRFGIGVMKMP